MGIGGIRLPKLGAHPLLLLAELGPEHDEYYGEADDPTHLRERNRGPKKSRQNAGIDRVTDHGIGAGRNQLVVLLNGDRAAPVAGKVLPRPYCEEKAGNGNCSSNAKRPEARRPEL